MNNELENKNISKTEILNNESKIYLNSFSKKNSKIEDEKQI